MIKPLVEQPNGEGAVEKLSVRVCGVEGSGKHDDEASFWCQSEERQLSKAAVDVTICSL